MTSHSQNGFLKYNEKLFSWDDQIRLVESLREAKAKGAYVLATNADCPMIRNLYQGSFSLRSVERRSAIAASAVRRGVTAELIITSW